MKNRKPIARQVIERTHKAIARWRERLDHATTRQQIKEALRMLDLYEGIAYELEEAA